MTYIYYTVVGAIAIITMICLLWIVGWIFNTIRGNPEEKYETFMTGMMVTFAICASLMVSYSIGNVFFHLIQK
jgi:hypothetical protein